MGGTVFSMPKVRGGRSWKPLLAEDEMLMGGREREFRHAQRVHEKEKVSRDPFNEDNARAWYQRGTTGSGRSLDANAPRIQAGYGRRNPNANNFKHKSLGIRGVEKSHHVHNRCHLLTSFLLAVSLVLFSTEYSSRVRTTIAPISVRDPIGSRNNVIVS